MAAAISAAAPTGTLTRKMARQPSPSPVFSRLNLRAHAGDVRATISASPGLACRLDAPARNCAEVEYGFEILAEHEETPFQSGRASTWAGAVVYALGQVNFLFDSATKPYATADDLSAAFGIAKSTLSAKAKQVRDLTKMSWGTAEFLREDMIEASL